jgi:hypothetical protein
MKRKPLYLKLEIDGYQEDQIVGESIKEAFHRNKSISDTFEFPEDRDALHKALKLVYHYYSGKLLK